jgi:hypothetical protein
VEKAVEKLSPDEKGRGQKGQARPPREIRGLARHKKSRESNGQARPLREIRSQIAPNTFASTSVYENF